MLAGPGAVPGWGHVRAAAGALQPAGGQDRDRRGAARAHLPARGGPLQPPRSRQGENQQLGNIVNHSGIVNFGIWNDKTPKCDLI